MTRPNIEGAIAYALNRLATELPSHYTYHNLAHTQDGVLPAAVRLAQASGVAQAEIDLLRVAAAFHDIGFIHRAQGHEISSSRIAAQVLPGFGFEAEAIDAILGMILATRLPQSPRTPLEEILADADLDSLGRAEFYARSLDLRQELLALGQEIDEAAWRADQLAFLRGHRYFTPAAKSIGAAGKALNLQLLEEKLAAGAD